LKKLIILFVNDLAFRLHAFGAPYNMSDSITTKVVPENPNYNVLILVKAKTPVGCKLIPMNNLVVIENGTGKPEFNLFLKNFEKENAQSLPYIVLHGHPNQYTTPEKKEEFKKVIQFLLEKKVQFINPDEFYLEQSKLAKK